MLSLRDAVCKISVRGCARNGAVRHFAKGNAAINGRASLSSMASSLSLSSMASASASTGAMASRVLATADSPFHQAKRSLSGLPHSASPSPSLATSLAPSASTQSASTQSASTQSSTSAIAAAAGSIRTLSTTTGAEPSAEEGASEGEEIKYSKHEYPTRKEAPIISRNTPAQAKQTPSAASRSPNDLKIPNHDPFDDACSLTDDEISTVLDQQKQEQERLTSSMSSFPITDATPSFIPPNISSDQLEAPKTQITELPNGVRVVSQDVYSQMCTVGVVVNAGSRHEQIQGTAHLLESMALLSTRDYPDAMEIPKLLLDWGATHFANANREQTLYCIDVLRPNVEKAMHLISQVVLHPNLSEEEVEQCKMLLAFQAEQPIPQVVLGEAVHVAAYGAEQQLGRRHFATLDNIPNLSVDSLRDFWRTNILQNPEGLVVSGAGIGHKQLVEMAQRYFGDMEQKSSPLAVPSIYRGGTCTIEPMEPLPMEEMPDAPPAVHDAASADTKETDESIMPQPEDYCHVTLAFPVGGWHSQHEMVTACVLQTLLGGGSSFSAGGPGKGMYTRMYRNVLNRFGKVESAEAVTSFTDETGLMGVSGSTAAPEMVHDLVMILTEQLINVIAKQITDEELLRAKNMLKCNVLSQLESRLVLFEDIGRQVLTYDKHESAKTTCARIDAVKAEDMKMLIAKMLQSGPTIAATGKHLDKVPNDREVSRWLR